MKRIKLTYHPYLHIQHTQPMSETKAQEVAKQFENAFAPNIGLFKVDIEIINA